MPNLRRRSTGTAGAALLALVCALLLVPASAPAAKRNSVRATVSLGYTKLGLPTHRARARRAPRARIAQQACANANVVPAAGNMDVIRDAILCLHNRIRADRDLPLLRENARLQRAAAGHSANMVDKHFFAHTTPAGVSMVDRIFRANYASRNQSWAFGENIAWGTGRLSTPKAVMDAWMNSSGHRANILRRNYRELGVGVVTGVPRGGNRGATYTADFGVRG